MSYSASCSIFENLSPFFFIEEVSCFNLQDFQRLILVSEAANTAPQFCHRSANVARGDRP